MNTQFESMISRRRARLMGAVLTSVGFLLSAGTVGAAENWNLANAYGATSIHGEGNVVFADAIAKLTNGEIKVTVHTGGALGYKSKDHFDAVSDGAVEIADTPGNFLGGIDPFMLLSSLPFLAKTVDDARVLMDVAMPEYEKIFEAGGQKVLYASPWPASGIWAKKAIGSAADLDAVKIRTYDPSGTKTFKAIGAAPIQLAWADVVPQLATGGISAVLTSAEGGVTQKFVQHTPHFTEINYAVPLNFVHMNMETYDALSPELQAAVMAAADEASARNWAEVVGRTQRNYDILKGEGGIIATELSDNFLQDLGKAGGAVLDEWLAKTGDRGASIIAEYRKRTNN
ncbi:TRAP transporter substrate-binding protein [Pelagibius sp. Alg239-R121]|uniref:TRAP transporter substrate-binding protein n=1 Tax=Pelagibius sp. Alg239-R121 TaxID=2993448 RepID=UPI0024A63FFF|nr:TRAP transporter substrate-binding protein [Pelagibius sp. Alg239-R121]